MKIGRLMLVGVVLLQIGAFALSAVLWSNTDAPTWIGSLAWTLIFLAFLSSFFEKRHTYSSVFLKRVRNTSAAIGMSVLFLYLIATRLFGFESSDSANALICLGSFGPFAFLAPRAFGKKRGRTAAGN